MYDGLQFVLGSLDLWLWFWQEAGFHCNALQNLCALSGSKICNHRPTRCFVLFNEISRIEVALLEGNGCRHDISGWAIQVLEE